MFRSFISCYTLWPLLVGREFNDTHSSYSVERAEVLHASALHTHTHTNTHIDTHIHTHTYIIQSGKSRYSTRLCTPHTHTHKHTHRHTYTNTHTHTHTNIHVYCTR